MGPALHRPLRLLTIACRGRPSSRAVSAPTERGGSKRGGWGTSCSKTIGRQSPPIWVQSQPRRRRQARRPACGHRAGAGAALFEDSVRCAVARLLAAAPEVLRSSPAALPPPGRTAILPGRRPWRRGRRRCMCSPPAFMGSESRRSGCAPSAAAVRRRRSRRSSTQADCGSRCPRGDPPATRRRGLPARCAQH